MRKIVKQIINQEFLPFSPKKVEIGDVLDFDCYIKRFNGYAIIIEAGTTITQAFKAKIDEHHFIYVKQSEADQYKTYAAEKNNMESGPVKRERVDVGDLFEHLIGSLNECSDMHQQVELIYKTAMALMAEYFTSDDEKIPLNYIEQYSDVFIGMIDKSSYGLSEFLEYFPDSYDDAAHNVNVSFLSVLLGKELGSSHLQLRELAIAGILHDIGKVRIDQKILNKNTALDYDEFEVVQEHPLFSVEIAKNCGIDDVNILTGIRYHHEKLDGSGYPEGLSGNKIPKMAQILGICDIFDALTTDRLFRGKYSSFDALMLMKKEMSQQLNGSYIDTFIKLLK